MAPAPPLSPNLETFSGDETDGMAPDVAVVDAPRHYVDSYAGRPLRRSANSQMTSKDCWMARGVSSTVVWLRPMAQKPPTRRRALGRWAFPSRS